MALSDDQLQALLIQNGILTPETAVEHLEAAKKASVSLSEILLEKNLITEENLGQMIASYLKVPFVTLAKTPIPREVFLIIPERIARKRKVIAFAQDPSGVKVAMTDPANNDLISLISKKTGQTIIPHLALERDISNIYQLYRPDLQKAFDELIKREAYGKPENLAFEEAPITKVVDLLIQHAYQNKTSDIHIEPQENNSLIRLRIDGILHDVLVVPKPFHDRIITRIKVLSKLRTDEHLSAQDGKMRITLEEEKLDIRVSIIPIVDGEKVVLRLLSSKSRRLSLLDLGMNEDDLKKV